MNRKQCIKPLKVRVKPDVQVNIVFDTDFVIARIAISKFYISQYHRVQPSGSVLPISKQPLVYHIMSSILVLGAGELGAEVLKSLAAHPSRKNAQISVLLRPSTINSTDANKAAEVATIKALGITLVPGDIIHSSPTEPALLFSRYHSVLSCTGFIAGPGTQMKIAEAALAGSVKRYFPWQFGVDYDVLGRGSA